MPRLASPWLVQGLLPRLQPQSQTRTLIYRSPSQIKKNRQYRRRLQDKTPRQKPVPLYETSPLVLDLDAEDNPRVRSATEQDEEDQAELWSRNPRVDALAGRVEAFRQELAQSERLWKAPLGPFDSRRLSDRDVLSVAFLGAGLPGGKDTATESVIAYEQARQIPRGDNTAEILAANGFPQRILKDDTKTINFMLHWQEQHGNQHIKEEDVSKLKGELSRQSLPELRRITAQLLQTDIGSRMMSLCGAEIVFALVDSTQPRHGLQLRDGADATEALVFLSNLAIGLRAHNLNIPAPLRGLGLRLAAKLFLLPTMTNFIRANQQSASAEETDSLDANALQEALRSLLDSIHSRHVSTPGSCPNMRSEVFNLMAGQGATNGALEPSIRAMISKSHDFREAYKTYILLLGEVGAVRSLWYEYRGSTGFKSPKIDMNLILFTNATLRAVSLVRQQQQTTVVEAVGSGTGDYAQDAELDRQLVAKLETSSPNAGLEPGSPPYPVFSPTRTGADGPAGIGTEPRAEIQEFLKAKDIQSALAVLQPVLGHESLG